MAAREPVAVVGAGYVGLVTAAGFASLGNEVHCVEVDEAKLEALRCGESPIYEPGLEELLQANADRLHFWRAVEEVPPAVRLFFVAVGTPPTASGDADLTAVYAVTEAIASAGGERAIVMKSTVPCGTGAALIRRLGPSHPDLAYVSCPEFLREGSAVSDFTEPDRVVVGDRGDWAGEAVVELYRPLLDRGAPLVRTDIASAEMIKLAANAFLATKISFINEIANVCEETGADVVEVARGMGLDRRIGTAFLRAGIGYGGSCFTKDVSALKLLASNSGYHFQLLAAVIEVNELQKRRVVQKLSHYLGGLAGQRIALLGLAFKPFTDDMRGASSIVLAERLRAEGATVRAYDPVATARARTVLPELEYATTPLGAVEGADAAVLVTEWPELVGLDWREVAVRMAGRLVVDGRNALDPAVIQRAGLTYEAIGRPLAGAASELSAAGRVG